MLRIGDVAKEIGVTVRTLRHWESLGLITATRSESGQRFFSSQQLVRLSHVLALKRVGFSLAHIADVLERERLDAAQLLNFQREILEEEASRIGQALGAVEAVLTAIDAGESLSPAALCHMIKMGEYAMDEEAWQKVYDKYYSEEEQQAWLDAKEALGEDSIKEIEQAWPRLIAHVEAILDQDPASDEAQACVREWNRLTGILVQANPALAEGAGRMYDDMDNWPEGAPESPFSPAVWTFIQRAGEASKSKA